MYCSLILKEAKSYTYGSHTHRSEVAVATCFFGDRWSKRQSVSRKEEGGKALRHTLMWVHDESLLPDPHLFIEPGYTRTIANHLALSLSRVARLN